MDKRNRPAFKRHRNNTGEEFQTISLKLDEKVLENLTAKVAETEDKNMSRFIEETMLSAMEAFKIDIPKRREYGSYPVKKTFTFSKNFITEVKKRNTNVSFFVDSMLAKAFNLDQ